jgi:hypothetical protein
MQGVRRSHSELWRRRATPQRTCHTRNKSGRYFAHVPYWRTRIDEYNAIGTSDEQLRALRKPFGDLPLLVLTRGVSPYAVPGKPQSALNKATEGENEKIHAEIAALSTRGKQRVVPGASHVIEAEQPGAVAQAVLEVLHQIK